MKQKILALLLAFAMVLSLAPFSPLTAVADEVYTVILDPGEGSDDEPIVYRSNEGTIADSAQNAQNCQFYYETDGSLWFCMDPELCPFTAKPGYSFDGWDPSIYYLPLFDAERTFTAMWTYTPPAPCTISPSSYELAGSGYTDIPCMIETLEFKKIQTGDGELDPMFVQFEYYAGTLNDGAEHEIPFKVDEQWHFGASDTAMNGNDLSSVGSDFVMSVWIDPEDYAAAPAGTYTGVLNYTTIWVDSEYENCAGDSGTIALTLTIEPTLADGYYLIGQNGWSVDAIDAAQQFTANPGNANEYLLVTTLDTGDNLKVVRVANGAIAEWYPDPGDNYTVDAAHAGLVTIYFKTTYDDAWSAFGGHIYIEPIYTVTLVPGDGSGEPIVYHSNEGTIAAAWNNAQNCQFYIENDGSMAFRLNPDYCPDTFTAPEGYEFDTWSNANRYIPLTARETTITALWKATVPDGPASYTISPAAYVLTGSGYTDITCTVETLVPGKIEFMYGGERTADSVTLTYYGGTLSDGAGHEIPFKVDAMYHFGPNDSMTTNGLNSAGQEFTVAVWIDPEDFDAAVAGTYTGVMNYDSRWVAYPEYFAPGESGSIALTLTVEPAPAEPLFAAHNLVLSGQIGVNFYMDLSTLSDEQKEDSYMTFTISGAGDVSDEPICFDANRTDEDGLYHKFTCYVNAIQMADTITATYHWFEGGVEKTTAIEYSVKRYILDFAEIQDAYDFETLALVHALADYCHFVQIFLSAERGWELDTDYAVMDEFFTEEYDFDAVKAELANYAGTKTDETNGDLAGVSFSLVLDSETAIWVYFTPSAAYTGTPTVTIDGTEYFAEKKGGRYAVVIADIPANRLGDSKTIVFTTANGSATVELSALSYVKAAMDCYTNTNALNAMAAIYSYAKAADFYAKTH